MNIKKIKSVIAIDIDASSIKAAIGHVVKNEIVLKKLYTSLLPEHVFSDGKILNGEIFESILKNMLRINKIKETNCFCCFESSQMISRSVVVPNSPNANFQDVARFEMAQHLPIELKNYGVQSKKIHEFESEGKAYIESYTTAIPKMMIDQMNDALRNVGLKPLVLDTHSNSIAKLFETQGTINNKPIDNKNIALIEFGYESIYITMLQNGKFKMNRLISIGSKDLDYKISKLLEIPIEQAIMKRMQVADLSKKHEESEEALEDARLSNMVRSTIESWYDEIDKTFRFYTTRNKEVGNLDKIYIYGALTSINGMSEFCESHFKVPTERVLTVDKISGLDAKQMQDTADYFYAFGTMYRR